MHSITPPYSTPFYNRPTLTVARDLLGTRLVFRSGDSWETLLINEVEAYDGPEDKACHAHRGRTKRTEVMFGPAGHWYVYLCYGVHWLANLVVGPENYPAAVLIRGAGDFNGPGKLTKAIGITGRTNQKKVDVTCGFFITEGIKVSRTRIERTPRIGIDYAGPIWAEKPYRFLLR